MQRRTALLAALLFVLTACGDKSPLRQLDGTWVCDPQLTWERNQPGKPFPADLGDDRSMLMCNDTSLFFDTVNSQVVLKNEHSPQINWSGTYMAVEGNDKRARAESYGEVAIFELTGAKTLEVFAEEDPARGMVFVKSESPVKSK